VDGQEIHRRRDFRVLEPELPDVGIGDRLLDLAFDLIDQLRQLAPVTSLRSRASLPTITA
jgi:hypothetical protein